MEKTPKYKIIISERAKRMLGVHIHFLANVSPPAARAAKEAIIKSIRSLSVMPERFSFLNAEHISPNRYHKIFVKNWYLVLYQIKDQTVYVEYIVDCRQDFKWLL